MKTRYLAVFALLSACAQASAPPGGSPDRDPPRIVSSTPAQGAVVPDFNGDVVFVFDEGLSERGPREGEMVAVSPEAGDVEVSRSGKELKVRVKSGWQKNRVYHVTVMPGFADRFGNSRKVPYDLVFSTGGQILPTALGGLIVDRLTGRPVVNARVISTSLSDSTVYTTQSDTAGFYAFQGLPVGAYSTTAHVDLNRNRKIDGLEPRQTKTTAVSTVRDTQVVEFTVLAPDTTAPRLLRAEARDSMQIRIAFDDYIEAKEPLGGVAVELYHLPDSTRLPNGTALHIAEFEARIAAARDTARAGRPQPVVENKLPFEIPTQELIVVPNRPLAAKSRYRIIVRGIRNIQGVGNGGGTAVFQTR